MRRSLFRCERSQSIGGNPERNGQALPVGGAKEVGKLFAEPETAFGSGASFRNVQVRVPELCGAARMMAVEDCNESEEVSPQRLGDGSCIILRRGLDLSGTSIHHPSPVHVHALTATHWDSLRPPTATRRSKRYSRDCEPTENAPVDLLRAYAAKQINVLKARLGLGRKRRAFIRRWPDLCVQVPIETS